MHATASIPTPLDLPAARQAREGLAGLLLAERTAAAEFLLALSDFDRRRGWEPLGHASLFAFLVAELRLSNGAAFWRMSAARLLQRFPDLIEPLRDGRLCLSTTAELAKVLTEENRAQLLPRFFGLSAREAKEVTAELLPREVPPTRAVVTAAAPLLVVQGAARSPAAQSTGTHPEPGLAVPQIPLRTSEVSLRDPARIAGRRDDVEPLTADLRRLHVTVSSCFLEKVARARDGLSHAIPGASTEQVLEAALDLLLEKQARARAQVKKPRRVDPSPTPTDFLAEPTAPRRTGPREHVPADVRRAVWERDGGRCQWPLDSGGCCSSTRRLELDHVVPWARGGVPTVGGLRLLCHTHNRLAAKLEFGARWMGRYAATTR